MSPESALPTFRLEPGVEIAQANPWRNAPVTLASPAAEVVTDLTAVKAATTHPATALREAEQLMIYLGVRMLFVVSRMPLIEGLVTASDLRGDAATRTVQERGVRYDDLSVGDVMTPLASLDAIDHEVVRSATVGNLVATLQRFGRDHLLVVEKSQAGSSRRVRGVVSRSQIERQLGSPIGVMPVANSFSEIERALL